MADRSDHERPAAVIVPLRLLGRVAVTVLVVALACLAGRWVWVHYNVEPWTRDGRVRADVVQVSPDVSGLVTEVDVRDAEMVHAGQVLFVLDRPRYELAERQAEAAMAAAQVALEEAIREDRRNRALDTLVTTEQAEQGASRVAQLRAQLSSAIVQRDLARLNLERTTVKATVNGIVTNVELQVGDYASVGRQVVALINTDSIYVDGYFEETKLPRIRVGDPATVRIMGLERRLDGVVESIDAGIEDRERSASSRELANVNPTFSWVRLAQRIPVRIRLERVPEGIRLIAGRTATVSIEVPEGRPLEGAL
jgi:multidrug resistance efflux pump